MPSNSAYNTDTTGNSHPKRRMLLSFDCTSLLNSVGEVRLNLDTKPLQGTNPPLGGTLWERELRT